VTLEFKEAKTTITDADKKEREQIAVDARARIASGETIENIAEKLTLNHENVRFESGSGTKDTLPSIVLYTDLKDEAGKHLSPVVKTKAEKALTLSGETAKEGYSVIEWDISQSGSTKIYGYKALWIDETPSAWQVAKTQDGKSLNDQYLSDAQMVFSQNAQPQIQLTFNEEGKKIFGEISERLIGKQLAIFVGGDLITAPVIQTKIADGLAVISGNYTIEEAKEQAQDIKTGIVPAPIYLSSERTIDAKIGRDALQTILVAGVIGLGVIILFLTYVYRVAGLLAGVALIIYAILLVALVKSFSIVLTLASIAGVILSIGLAIDANILIFERMKESLRDGKNLVEATLIGFEKSWSAIWDSHVTSLTSAFILFIFGVNLIKGFGLMLGLGIILSLFTAMWVSRILLLSVTAKFQHSKESFIGKLRKNPEKS
jgi:protein-export membrane protein SecD